MNHGHVTPNPDGSKARCGGPALCSKCAQELAQLQQNNNRAKISDIGKAANQPISPKTWEEHVDAIEQLQRTIQDLERTINEQAKQIDSLEARLHNQAVTIRVMDGTIAELPTTATENPCINRLLSQNQPLLVPETANLPGEPVAVHTAPNIRWAGGK